MEYEQYLEKFKKVIKNLSTWQKMALGLLLLMILVVGIFIYNPPKKLLEMRNASRRSDVTSILNAVYQYSTNHEGNLPFNLTNQPSPICRSDAVSCEGAIDLSAIVAQQKNIFTKVPVDPQEKDKNLSGYQIFKSANGRINVSAPLAENKAVISLSK